MSIIKTWRGRGGRRGAYPTLLALLVVLPLDGVAAAGLLRAASEPEAARAGAAAPPPLGTVRQRFVRVDRGELTRHVAPIGFDVAFDRLERARRLDGEVMIELFPDAVATFHRTNVDTVGGRGLTWTGEPRGRPFSFAMLVIEDGRITGAVQLGRRYFRIDPIAGDLHRVTEIDRSLLPHREDDFIVPPTRPDSRTLREDRAGARAASRVKVLAAYTKRARNQSANIVNEIKLAVQMTNAAYANTNVQIKLLLVGTMQTGDYNEGPDTSTRWGVVLEEVSGFRGAALRSVRQKRNRLDADLVALIRSNSSVYCGLAWAPEFPGPGTQEYGFSEHALDCLAGGIVFPHELGHNMGLFHDRTTHASQGGGNPPNSKYNFGYINNNAGIIDIMSYLASCTGACSYIQWFSTARLKYSGTVKMGVPQGSPGAADATRRLNETRGAIAAYR